MQTPLTPQAGQQLVNAVKQLHELQSQTLVTKERDADIAGLTNFITRELFEHADELVGCWLAITNEYAPLVSAIGAVLRRVSGMNTLREAPAVKAEETTPAAEPTPENAGKLPTS